MEERGIRYTKHHTQKISAGLRPRAVPAEIVGGRRRQEGAARWREASSKRQSKASIIERIRAALR